MPSTLSGWHLPQSMTCTAVSNSRLTGTEDGVMTHCMASDACCAAAPSTSPTRGGRDCWPRRTEFLAYFTTGRISNGPTEAVNLLIKKTLRGGGHGFRSFRNYRLRLLLHCGITWQHHTPTPLRGRLPRLAA
jgi:hypothetical protein